MLSEEDAKTVTKAIALLRSMRPENEIEECAHFGTAIRLRREVRGLSLQQLADAVGCTKSHIHDMENSRATNPTARILWGLSEALDMAPALLLKSAALAGKPEVG